MNEHFLVFTLEGRRCALPLARVERVLRAVEITVLPGANWPPLVRGVVNVHGAVIPIFDLRKARCKNGVFEEVCESEQMILVALAQKRRALILCDHIEGLREVEAPSVASAGAILPQTSGGPGDVLNGDVLNVVGDLIYVNDLDAIIADGFWEQWEGAQTENEKCATI